MTKLDRTFRFIGVSSFALLAGLAAMPAFAQQEAQRGGVLEEIIVTAQKRAENVQTVPIAVTVLSGDRLSNQQAFNIEGLNMIVPSLNFRKGGTTINSTLFLRGVGTASFSIAGEPSVGFVLDGVVLARAGEAFGDLYDLERIEVLRGPQGTLFGKNTSAGVINVTSKRPSATPGGQVEVGIFEGGEYKIKASADAPLGEKVLSRLTAFYGSYKGNIENLFDGKKINGYERYGARGLFEITASDALKFTAIADYRKADDDCCGEVIGTLAAPTNANNIAINSILTAGGAKIDGIRTRQVHHNQVTQNKETSWGLSLQGDYTLANDLTITSITAYRRSKTNEIREGDWLDRTAAYVGGGFNQLHDVGPQVGRTFTQELRLTSPSGERFEYTVGAFYYRAKNVRDFRRDVISCTASTLALDATGARPCSTAPGASTFVSAFSSANFGSTFTNWAVFGQGSFKITEAFRLIGGLRYTDDKLTAFHDRVPSPVALGGLRTDLSGFRLRADNTNVSGKVGLQFDISDQVMSYFTYARGYKGPAFNVFFNQNPTQLNEIEPETADSFELGLKNTLFDDRVVLNVAGFYAKYKNFQANNFDTLNGVVITRLTNAGKISTRGIEIDLLARPTEALTLSGGIAYTDAQIDEFRIPPGSPPTATTRKGETLPFAPKWKASLAAEYVFADMLPWDVALNGSVNHTSKQAMDLQADPVARALVTADAYTTFDASIAVYDKDDRYRLTFLVKNLFDRSFPATITPGGPGGTIRYFIPREADRYIGATFRVKFGG